jgi:hypothetical protein
MAVDEKSCRDRFRGIFGPSSKAQDYLRTEAFVNPIHLDLFYGDALRPTGRTDRVQDNLSVDVVLVFHLENCKKRTVSLMFEN